MDVAPAPPPHADSILPLEPVGKAAILDMDVDQLTRVEVHLRSGQDGRVGHLNPAIRPTPNQNPWWFRRALPPSPVKPIRVEQASHVKHLRWYR